MELVLQPDTYIPNVDNEGNYVDTPPSSIHLSKGIYCPCTNKKDKMFTNTTKFSAHLKTKMHQRWLQTLNYNKSNYYRENIELRELVDNQRRILAQTEQELQNRSNTISYLTQQLMNHNQDKKDTVGNLLDMDV